MYPAGVSQLRELLEGLSITYALIAVNVAVSLVGFWALRKKDHRRYFIFIPSKANPHRSAVGAVLSHFAHGDVGHLLVNLLAFYLFGPRVEEAMGPIPFLGVYLASGAVGTFFVWLFHRDDPRHAALGASGCIAGVLFAWVVLDPTSSLQLLYFPRPIPAPVFAVLYLVLSSVKMGSRDGVAHEAHIGGAVAGLVLTGLLADDGFGPLIHAVQHLVG